MAKNYNRPRVEVFSGRVDAPKYMSTPELKSYCAWINKLLQENHDERLTLFSGASFHFAELRRREKKDALANKTMDEFMDEEFVNLE